MRAVYRSLRIGSLITILSTAALVYVLIAHSDLVLHSPIAGGAIISLLVLGLTYSGYSIARLWRGVSQWKRLSHSFPYDDPEPRLVGSMGVFRGKLNSLVSLHEADRTAVIGGLSRTLEWPVNFLEYAAGLSIGLGLLGTFLGLMSTMEGIKATVDTIAQASGGVDGQALLEGLAAPLGGMSSAFSASMLGLTGSLVLGGLSHLIGRASEGWIHDIEQWANVAVNAEEAPIYDGPIEKLSMVVTRLYRLQLENQAKLDQHNRDVHRGIQELADQGRLKASVDNDIKRVLQIAAENGGGLLDSSIKIQNSMNILTTNLLLVVQNLNVISQQSEAKRIAIEHNSATIGECIGYISEYRADIATAVGGLSGHLSRIQRATDTVGNDVRGLTQTAMGGVSSFEHALTAIHQQRETVLECVREITRAKVALVTQAAAESVQLNSDASSEERN